MKIEIETPLRFLSIVKYYGTGNKIYLRLAISNFLDVNSLWTKIKQFRIRLVQTNQSRHAKLN